MGLGRASSTIRAAMACPLRRDRCARLSSRTGSGSLSIVNPSARLRVATFFFTTCRSASCSVVCKARGSLKGHLISAIAKPCPHVTEPPNARHE